MEIFKKGSINFLYKILGGILGFAIQCFAAKILGASEFGKYSYFMGLVNTLGLIFTFGIAFYFPKIFQNKIDKITIMLYKSHFMGVNVSDFTNTERIIHFDSEIEPDINLFMKDVDVLITDYSGAYFDFKLTSKPIIPSPFDLEEYMSFSRKLYIEYESLEELKGEGWNEILMILKQKKFASVLNTKVKLNDYYDGNSSKRLLKSIKQRFFN
ncbi:CDP-glycerol glycerophosphotransferase family protein [Polaribacter sp. HL-MS24]|uniref:CDP-glycerol glycerophosphotransferase family protein n=1 Tax=Polaribacter sp. HL-MS24 TaxID=3077735 RepID=UPI00293454D8|nr:CDP-glycerol glycerophosphotransferase family protein [Polaribacter sp. HL-MS24]WOC39794.1 CDP-glycerol glycerophosphotransferase family protein [Polaribacter sp. HL-MS24]